MCDGPLVIAAIADGLWGVGGVINMGAGVSLPLRSTIVRLSDGSLWVHSPVRFTDAEARALDALGPVRHIVAPNGFHHLYAGAAQRRWPEATLSKSPALVKKRPDPTATHVLGDGSPPWGDEVRALPIAGAPSGLLLWTDAVFNVRGAPNLASRWAYRLMGIGDGLAMGRLFKFAHRDRRVVGDSMRAILSLDLRRLVPCHGDVVDVVPLRRRLRRCGPALIGRPQAAPRRP